MRKGQYFLISSILIIGFLASFTFSRAYYSVSDINQGSEITKQVITEFPKAINSILVSEYSSKNLEIYMRSYVNFQQYYLKKHGLNSHNYFLIGLKDSNNINITFGNFFGDLENLEISVNNKTKYLSVNDSEIRTINFENIPEFFNVFLSYKKDGESFNHTLTTEKGTFYMINLETDFKNNHLEEFRSG